MVGVALAFVLRSGVAVRYVTFWRDEDDVHFISAGIFFNHVKDIIQLQGCQGLLEDLSDGDNKSPDRAAAEKRNRRHDVVMAVLRIDDTLVDQTDWKRPSPHCWDQVYHIHINKLQILRIDVYWRDSRSLCAVGWLTLGDIAGEERQSLALQLQPRGLLFVQVPVVIFTSLADI
ncbi:Serine/threonine-protein kinase N [Amphibalanus amphitrite]|uniref:Serine/threonine-protein kinase N n=1 Tax=Amphibalanus amphitrite TaxID=1232801 RepID=A0A6A4X211_AMPAM|nr:Serine/threonine-protein kinase N [Amphibalanus amphitrite]